MVRDVIAREPAPPADRLNTVAVAEHPDPELAITLDDVEIRGAERATALDGVTMSIRDLHAGDVVEAV